MKNNFIQRAVTGVLFVVVLVGCILYSPLSFGILFTLISALSVYEFTHLMNQSGEVSINKAIAGLGGAYLFLALMGFCTQATDARVFLPYLALLLYLMITVSEEKEPDRQLGILHAQPAIRSLALCPAECAGFPEHAGDQQRNVQSDPPPFHFRVHLAERYRCILCGVNDRQTSSFRTYLT